VRDQFVEFFEGVLVEQQLDSFPRRKLALGVLAGAALRSSTLFGGSMAPVQFFEAVHGTIVTAAERAETAWLELQAFYENANRRQVTPAALVLVFLDRVP
jgi:hypothetical protein